LQIVIDAFLLLVLGWPGYLLSHVTGRDYGRYTNHFSTSSPLFGEDERSYILISDISLVAWSAILFYLSFFVFTPLEMIKYYFFPYLVVNFWLVLYTKLHHTHPALPHFSGNDWNWLQGALSTVDRDYGFLFNMLHHHIGDTHVVHHLYSNMPHYHAEEATVAVRPVLGPYYTQDNSSIVYSLFIALRDCRYVTPEKKENGGEGNVWWFETTL